ncbi:alpha/beta hydrolase family protein [Gordonia liuliyuniae]|uniref:Alpha/beta fold hydrolase n=1 Tax=Gordonia liuliyuniae TaxID=2911517 RepID=A0ABS9IXT0_9ACTN|nr:prolyl oligopeptidase family serine peptidase [Gordonia liuliyuniae]MCF8590392.1 alpha/beta fold hydrolase [Gordonia liuliyuniae]
MTLRLPGANRRAAHQVFSQGFYPDPEFDFTVRCVLGGTGYGAAEPGEVFATIDTAPSGDHQRWFDAWSATGERARALADAEWAAGRMAASAGAYLRSATYFSVAVDAASALDDDEALHTAFRRHRSSWDGFVEASGPLAETVAIPYESTAMPGVFFTPVAAPGPRPTLVMVNGSDGAISSMWGLGAAGALERGYNALVFDGPGQQSMLFEQGVGFRPDWEAVLTPVVDFLLARDDVDPDRLAVWGISQGGFWVPQALAYEKRFAAAVADPGVVDVSTSWNAHIPESLLKKFRAGDRKAFDRNMAFGMKFSTDSRRTWRFRSRPYGQESYFDTLAEVSRYALSDSVAAQISTPLLITDPEHEQFWPGQSAALADLAGDATLVPFTASEGADFHCQPMARKLCDARVFGWLETQFGAVTAPSRDG